MSYVLIVLPFFGGELVEFVDHHRLKNFWRPLEPQNDVPLDGSAGIKSMAIGSMGYFTYKKIHEAQLG